jgi:hypothetical protein
MPEPKVFPTPRVVVEERNALQRNAEMFATGTNYSFGKAIRLRAHFFCPTFRVSHAEPGILELKGTL